MPIPLKEEKELWVSWTHDALAAFAVDESLTEPSDIADQMVDVAAAYADSMLDEYEERFASGAGRSKRTRKKKRKVVEEDEDDDDDEDDDG